MDLDASRDDMLHFFFACKQDEWKNEVATNLIAYVGQKYEDKSDEETGRQIASRKKASDSINSESNRIDEGRTNRSRSEKPSCDTGSIVQTDKKEEARTGNLGKYLKRQPMSVWESLRKLPGGLGAERSEARRKN